MKIMALSACLSLVALSASAQVPHTFSPGTPAKASEVNDNFNALDARITANETAIASVGAGGASGWKVIDSTMQDFASVVTLINQGEAFAKLTINNQDYFVNVQRSNVYTTYWGNGSIYFASSDCTGQAYAIRQGNVFPTVGYSGVMLLGDSKLYDQTSDPAIQVLTYNSIRGTDFSMRPLTTTCFPYGGTFDFSSDPDTSITPVEVVSDLFAIYPPPYDVVPQ